MKSSKIKSTITHLFKGKSHKLDKYPTFDSPTILSEPIFEDKKLGKSHGNKKSHKKTKTNLNLIDTKKKNLGEFPVLPSPINDSNESAKLTAQEFAKAVGIKILHKTDEEEDEDCNCEYCRARYNPNPNPNLNLDLNMTLNSDGRNALPDQTFPPENNISFQQIPNVSSNQFSLHRGTIISSTNTATTTTSTTNTNTNGNGNGNVNTSNNNSNNTIQDFNIPPFPTYNMNFNFGNDKLNKCSSNSSLSSNHSIVNSRTIGTPGYNCHRNRKNSVSKVVDMSLFIPPTEEEIRLRSGSSLSLNSTPETTTSTIQTYAPNEKFMGGSLDRYRNHHAHQNNYGFSPIISRERSSSTCIASTSRNNHIKMMSNSNSGNNINSSSYMFNDYRTSPIFRDSNLGYPSLHQLNNNKSFHRCDSGTDLNAAMMNNATTSANANANANINPSSPNKRPYPNSLASSSSSTTLSSSLSLTHITQSQSLAQIPSSQSSSSSIQKIQISSKYSPRPRNAPPSSTTPLSSKSSISSCSSSITTMKPQSNLKITRSVTITEGTRRAEIDIQPIEPDEVKVYTKGRFTITCEHSRRPSVHSFQV
ncbi:hypothetical protein LY90DRAFT_701055, partial [Neocallimastix californiae]